MCSSQLSNRGLDHSFVFTFSDFFFLQQAVLSSLFLVQASNKLCSTTYPIFIPLPSYFFCFPFLPAKRNDDFPWDKHCGSLGAFRDW